MELIIKELTKTYGSKKALNHFSYEFTPGIYGILGSNGAGKSTLMGMLTDTVKRTSGEILYNGQEILKIGEAFRKEIGYMPQEQGMYEDFSARRFLYYMAELKGIPRADCEREVEQALKITNLQNDSYRKIRGFSGGMKQRVMVAQALLGQPHILLLDEPTVGLDPKERMRFCNYIQEISRNRIILITTHIVSDIEKIAKEVLFMKKGRLVASGAIADLYEETNCTDLEELYLYYLEQ